MALKQSVSCKWKRQWPSKRCWYQMITSTRSIVEEKFCNISIRNDKSGSSLTLEFTSAFQSSVVSVERDWYKYSRCGTCLLNALRHNVRNSFHLSPTSFCITVFRLVCIKAQIDPLLRSHLSSLICRVPEIKLNIRNVSVWFDRRPGRGDLPRLRRMVRQPSAINSSQEAVPS